MARHTQSSVLFVFSLASVLLLSAMKCVQTPVAAVPSTDNAAVELDSANFDSLVLSGGRHALVEFYLPECGACAEVAWIADSLAAKFKDTILIGKVDVKKSKALADQYDAMTVPVFLLFQDGIAVSRLQYNSDPSTVLHDSLSAIVQRMLRQTLPQDTSKPNDTVADTLAPVRLLDTTNFDTISTIPMAMVEFFSPFCYHCTKMEPVVRRLAADYDGRVFVAKVLVEANEPLLDSFSVKSWPTFILFRSGTEVKRVVGSVPIDSLRRELDALLSGS